MRLGVAYPRQYSVVYWSSCTLTNVRNRETTPDKRNAVAAPSGSNKMDVSLLTVMFALVQLVRYFDVWKLPRKKLPMQQLIRVKIT